MELVEVHENLSGHYGHQKQQYTQRNLTKFGMRKVGAHRPYPYPYLPRDREAIPNRHRQKHFKKVMPKYCKKHNKASNT